MPACLPACLPGLACPVLSCMSALQAATNPQLAPAVDIVIACGHRLRKLEPRNLFAMTTSARSEQWSAYMSAFLLGGGANPGVLAGKTLMLHHIEGPVF